jgi:hypothetical protein
VVKRLHEVGQATTEFIVVLALMTFFGILLMNTMIGPDKKSGSIKNAEDHAINSISNDEK